ncbi:MAG TPA: LysR substrate-binding domain-containing protein [Ottowia sp.]|uniref:LysR substrate-binding domain-containing protein n=1 Tax=Ottowia sp. TaxID=1898956 RepID=UPI002C5E3174|nr:LysR substrate-binding domain-containing protein [Ottowia sp.]MCZ2089071.1 LysR family transcriptional regulator [Burkholderiales bacterium]HNI85857.1 LysR substrate-binding domain-containing protein [Ottowia sp.]HNJ46004.1 LysR substrate-binding domain-containing protein [Ottowia sp.]HNK52418.1 LysR substrate-binding domain-containing protein [Ottowia sp.]HNL42231.1 LysR substrate-binding domain-containing protein [Ottowia sp.]
MDLRQLEYFVRVAELGSFSRAALALDVAQPALSRQVRLLEVELRQNLLTRHGRGAMPTEAGQVLLEHARGILHQIEHARDELARLRGGLAGRVTLGLPPSVARALAVPLVQAFGGQLPEAQLSITEALSASMQEQLASGRLDIAVLYNAQPVPGLDIAPLARDELLLVQHAGARADAAPATLRDLAQLPLVIPSRPNAIRMHVETQMAAAGCTPQVALEIDGVATILALVEGGAGSAILSRHALAGTAHPEAFALRRIATPDGQPLQIPLYTALSALRPASATRQAALTLLRAQALTHLGSF